MAWYKQTMIGKVKREVDEKGRIWQTIIQGVNETKSYLGTIDPEQAFIYGMELKERGFTEV